MANKDQIQNELEKRKAADQANEQKQASVEQKLADLEKRIEERRSGNVPLAEEGKEKIAEADLETKNIAEDEKLRVPLAEALVTRKWADFMKLYKDLKSTKVKNEITHKAEEAFGKNFESKLWREMKDLEDLEALLSDAEEAKKVKISKNEALQKQIDALMSYGTATTA